MYTGSYLGAIWPDTGNPNISPFTGGGAVKIHPDIVLHSLIAATDGIGHWIKNEFLRIFIRHF